MLQGLKNDTAPGCSGITYILIKNASSKVQDIFRILAERVLLSGEIPLKWKLVQIYPIPKNND